MATTEDVKKLAALARITISDTELEKFTTEFDAILDYVGQLEALEVPSDIRDRKPLLRNVFRADTDPYAPMTHTEKIAAQFSAREGDSLSVKQIIQHD